MSGAKAIGSASSAVKATQGLIAPQATATFTAAYVSSFSVPLSDQAQFNKLYDMMDVSAFVDKLIEEGVAFKGFNREEVWKRIVAWSAMYNIPYMQIIVVFCMLVALRGGNAPITIQSGATRNYTELSVTARNPERKLIKDQNIVTKLQSFGVGHPQMPAPREVGAAFPEVLASVMKKMGTKVNQPVRDNSGLEDFPIWCRFPSFPALLPQVGRNDSEEKLWNLWSLWAKRFDTIINVQNPKNAGQWEQFRKLANEGHTASDPQRKAFLAAAFSP